jgi:predicted nucleic acid-binding protein
MLDTELPGLLEQFRQMMNDCIIASTALAKKAKILSDDHHYDEIKGLSRTWF